MAYLYYPLAFVFGLVCVLLMLLILIQKGRGGGLSAAFGGAGGNTAFGAKTGDMLTWITAAFFGVFLLLSIAMVWSTNYLHANATRSVPILPDEPTPFVEAGEDLPTTQPEAPATLPVLPATQPGTQAAPDPAGSAENPQ